jgi:hypothetical protein
MSRKLRTAAGSLLLLVLTIGATSCASTPPAQSSRAESPAPQVKTAQAPASQAATQSIDQAVRADADQMMSDIASAPTRVSLSSNPYDYAAVSPAFKRLVARGTPTVDAIAREIERSGDNGLREYLLAMAASQIEHVPDSMKQWSTAQEWLAQYRARR